MKHRQMLRSAVAVGLTGTAIAALTDTRQSFDQALAADIPAETSDLEAAAERYGNGYHGQDPAKVLADLVVDFDELRPLLDMPQPVASRCSGGSGRPPRTPCAVRPTRPGSPSRTPSG
ncbi:hypothetical protein V2J94_46335 [Streptomyces sp. DSM 41524]|uniref:Uncharacterized protein n=1 Tax=Streptomyces asiaticus subsp. ignotus TaxID=3098222 RepID=A0ABU7QCM0_9ACTN|nr:hypothetical protein [Streptomyces sp. DSM 41524]